MSEEGKDLEASELDFLQIFRYHDASIRNKLLSIFVGNFKLMYNAHKKGVIKLNLGDLESSIAEFENAAEQRTPIEEAEFMGRSLGSFLGIMEYQLPTARLSDEDADGLYESARMIAFSLKRTNKKIKLRFITNRVHAIAEKYKGRLTPQIKMVYRNIANAFVK